MRGQNIDFDENLQHYVKFNDSIVAFRYRVLMEVTRVRPESQQGALTRPRRSPDGPRIAAGPKESCSHNDSPKRCLCGCSEGARFQNW